jgi:hypothetical protein
MNARLRLCFCLCLCLCFLSRCDNNDNEIAKFIEALSSSSPLHLFSVFIHRIYHRANISPLASNIPSTLFVVRFREESSSRHGCCAVWHMPRSSRKKVERQYEKFHKMKLKQLDYCARHTRKLCTISFVLTLPIRFLFSLDFHSNELTRTSSRKGSNNYCGNIILKGALEIINNSLCAPISFPFTDPDVFAREERIKLRSGIILHARTE